MKRDIGRVEKMIMCGCAISCPELIIHPATIRSGLFWRIVVRMDSSTQQLRVILSFMASGKDVWKDFLDLVGPFIYHILKEDYCFYKEYDEHTRQEILHDIYLRAARYASRAARGSTIDSYKGYLRKIIRSVMCNKRRVLARCNRTIYCHEVASRDAVARNPVSNPSNWIEEQLMLRSVRKAVAQAIVTATKGAREPDKAARILERRLLSGDGYPDIATDYGMEIDAVRHIVHYYNDGVMSEARSMLGVNSEGGWTQ